MDFIKVFLKARWGRGSPRACDQLMHSSPTGWQWGNKVVSQGLTLFIPRFQSVGGLCTHWHQVVNFFHLVVVLAFVEKHRKCASDTVIYVLRRKAKAEDLGEQSVPGRPPTHSGAGLGAQGYTLSRRLRVVRAGSLGTKIWSKTYRDRERAWWRSLGKTVSRVMGANARVLRPKALDRFQEQRGSHVVGSEGGNWSYEGWKQFMKGSEDLAKVLWILLRIKQEP